jgi:hypothetical protein
VRRRTRAVPLARMRIDSVLRNLMAQPLSDWPKHLRLACEILANKRGVEDTTARAVLFASFSAAHRCAQAIDQRSHANADSVGLCKLHNVFARITRCIRRSPAVLRRVLDYEVWSSFQHAIIDLESMEVLIDSFIVGFSSWPKEETSLTVLRAVVPKVLLPKIKRIDLLRRCFAKGAIFLKNDYASLHSVDQRRVEAALTKLQKRPAEFDAADVCEAIANALDENDGHAVNTVIYDLITDYVAAVAEIWLQHSIRPGRAVDSHYQGRFHRFVDLVLTAVVEPWSKRHDGDQGETAASLRKAHARLSEDARKVVNPALRRSDVEWLVGEGHLRSARRPIQKTIPQTP